MKKFLFLLLLTPILGAAQFDTTKFYRSPNYGDLFRRAKINQLMIPGDTTTNKVGIAQIGSKLFVYSSNKWNEIGSVNIDGKLNISDTASMLAPYAKSIALGDYLKLDGTNLMNAPIRWSGGLNEVKLGYNAALNNTGNYVDAIGWNAAQNNTGNYIYAIGAFAAQNNTGNYLNAIGLNAGRNNTGSSNSAFGAAALFGNTGQNVVGIGGDAGLNNTYNNVNLFGVSSNATAIAQTVFSKDGSIMARLGYGNLTASRLYTLPDSSGTVALQSSVTEKLNISDTAAMLNSYVWGAGFGLSKSSKYFLLDTASTSVLSRQRADAKYFTLPSLTSGSVLFSNGTTIAQDNSGLFWDDTNNRLGIGTAAPSFKLQVEDNTNASSGLFFRNNSTGTSAITQLNASASTGTASLRAYSPLNSGWPGVGGFFTDGNLTGGMVLYNTSSANTQFWTNNARRMDIVGANGNVLIGTSTDAGQKFQVNGTASISGVLTLGTITITTGTGTPEGVVTATVGSQFMRTDGGAGTTLYVKESGAGNTGWIAK